MNVGFIGLGNLGRHLAARLLAAGFPLTVHDLDAAAVASLVAAGASAARLAARRRRGLRLRDHLPAVAALPSATVVAGADGVLAGPAPRAAPGST